MPGRVGQAIFDDIRGAIPFQELAGTSFAALKNDSDLNKAPRLERFGKSGHETYFVLDEQGKKVGVFKTNKNGMAVLSESEVVMSNVFKTTNQNVPGHTRLVTDAQGQIRGVVISFLDGLHEFKKIREESFAAMLEGMNILNKPIKTDVKTHAEALWPDVNLLQRITLIKVLLDTQVSMDNFSERFHELHNLTKQQIAHMLVDSYDLEEDDLHLENIGVNNRGDITRIDFDMAMYDEVTSRLESGARTYRYLVEDRFRITAGDLRNFPNLSDAQIHFWPTESRWVVGGGKGYKSAEIAAFSELSQDPVFKKAQYEHMLQWINKDPAEYERVLRANCNNEWLINTTMRGILTRQNRLRCQLMLIVDDLEKYGVTLPQDFIDAKLVAGDNVLHVAVKSGNYLANETLSYNQELKKGDFKRMLNWRNSEGRTPLMVAIEMRNYEAMREFLAAKASLTKTANKPQVCAELKIAVEKGDITAVKILIAHGARKLGNKEILAEQALNDRNFDAAIAILGTSKFVRALKLRGELNEPRQLIAELEQGKQYSALAGLYSGNRANVFAALSGDKDKVQAQAAGKELSAQIAGCIPASPIGCVLHQLVHREGTVNMRYEIPLPRSKDEGEAMANVLQLAAPMIKSGRRISFVGMDRTQVPNMLRQLLLSPVKSENAMRALGANSQEVRGAANQALNILKTQQSQRLLKPLKQDSLQVIKAALKLIDNQEDLLALHERLKKPEFNYLRELRSNLWLVRKLRGLHGNTRTWANIVNEINERWNELQKITHDPRGADFPANNDLLDTFAKKFSYRVERLSAQSDDRDQNQPSILP